MDRNFDAMQVVIIIVVALRKESVDRNDKSKKSKMEKQKSLSARRAWIEIDWVQEFPELYKGRSPQGERG